MRWRWVILLAAASSLPAQNISESYRSTASKLIDKALADAEAYGRLSYLCDRIGNRITGSDRLNEAIAWAAGQMRQAGLANVATPPVRVPHWVRGAEGAQIIAPVKRQLTMLGLGGSVGTTKGGITAEAIPVSSFKDLESLGRARVQGKIVVYNVPFETYDRTVDYRTNGASRAARLGAVAALVRSITPVSLQTAHTGAMEYSADAPKIPTAAITIENAMLIQRLSDSGNKVMVRLEMGAQTLPDADSANVIGEIPGREEPNEVVVIGGHLDSWDVGSGAQDDGVGCIAALEAARLIKQLGLRPRRTLRVVFWTSEENNGAGATAYRAWAAARGERHFAAIEMDSGAEKPVGFELNAIGKAQRLIPNIKAAAGLLAKIGAARLTSGEGGDDVVPIARDGVPALGLLTVATHYFDWHHSRADTPDKVGQNDFRKCIAAMAVMAYTLADMPD